MARSNRPGRNPREMEMYTNEQALTIVNAVWGHSPHAESQALEWAALISRANARHQFSEWTDEESDAVFFTGGNPDLVEALGHQTPETYLRDEALRTLEKLKLYEPK
jgi:hypothetical protein